MAKPAFQEDELELGTTEKIEAAHMYRTIGPPSKDRLLGSIARHGQIDGIMESALLLPLKDYYEIQAAFKAAPKVEKRRGR